MKVIRRRRCEHLLNKANHPERPSSKGLPLHDLLGPGRPVDPEEAIAKIERLDGEMRRGIGVLDHRFAAGDLFSLEQVMTTDPILAVWSFEDRAVSRLYEWIARVLELDVRVAPFDHLRFTVMTFARAENGTVGHQLPRAKRVCRAHYTDFVAACPCREKHIIDADAFDYEGTFDPTMHPVRVAGVARSADRFRVVASEELAGLQVNLRLPQSSAAAVQVG